MRKVSHASASTIRYNPLEFESGGFSHDQSQRLLSQRARREVRYGVLRQPSYEDGRATGGAGAEGRGRRTRDVSGGEPGSPALYIAMGHLLFESVADFQSSFGAHAAEIVADVPNYTNTQPVIQISEVKL
jgi:hypothetical protein